MILSVMNKKYKTIELLEKELGLSGVLKYAGRGMYMYENCGKSLCLKEIVKFIDKWISEGLCKVEYIRDNQVSIAFTDKLTKQKSHKEICFNDKADWFWTSQARI